MSLKTINRLFNARLLCDNLPHTHPIGGTSCPATGQQCFLLCNNGEHVQSRPYISTIYMYPYNN